MKLKNLLPLALIIPIGFIGFVASADGASCEVTLADANAVGTGTEKSLSDCIGSLNDGDTVTFADSVTTVTFSQAIEITNSLTIDGSISSGSVVLNANQVRAFSVAATDKPLNLSNLSIINAVAAADATGSAVHGGAIRTGSDLLLNNVSMINNVSLAGSGGAGFVGGDLILDGEINLDSNYALDSGGAFYVEGGVQARSGSLTAIDNEADESGGAFLSFGDLVLTGDVVATRNYAGNTGGFGYTIGSFVLAETGGESASITASFNDAARSDGGFVNAVAGVTIAGPITATSNTAFLSGGFIATNQAFSQSGGTIVADSNVSGADSGGFLYASSVVMTGGEFTNSSALGPGGAIYSSGSVSFSETVTESNNRSTADAGGFISAGSIAMVSLDSSGSYAHTSGGSLHSTSVISVTGRVSASTTRANSAPGGVINAAGSVSLGELWVLNSSSAGGGGAVNTTAGLSIAGSVTLENVSSTSSGGGIYAGATISIGGNLTATNLSSGGAGGVVATDAAMTIAGEVNSSNTQATTGGALYANSVSIGGGTITDSMAPTGSGGAIYAVSGFTSAGSLKITNSEALEGGAIHVRGTENSDGSMAITGDLECVSTDSTNGPGACVYSHNIAISGALKGGSIPTPVTGCGGMVFGTVVTLGSVSVSDVGSRCPGGVISTGLLSIAGHSELTNIDSGAAPGGAYYGTGIVALGSATATNVSGGPGGVFDVGDILVMGDFVSTQSSSSGPGGAIQVRSAATFSSVSITDSQSGSIGGGISTGGNLTILEEAIFADVSGTGPGGAISSSGDVTIGSATFSNVNSDSVGGAISASGDVVITEDAEFTEVSAVGPGGAISSSGDVTVGGAIFTNVSSDAVGGAISAGGNVVITGTAEFTGVSSTGPGGAITATLDVSMAAASFKNVSSGSVGGAIDGHNVSFSGDAVFENVSAIASGGAVYASGDVTAVSITALSSSSTSSSGGVIYAIGNLSVTESFVSTTTSAVVNGGAVVASDVTIARAEIDTALAGNNGGAIWATGDVALSSGFIRNSDAVFNGSAIEADGNIRLTDFEIIDNTANSATVSGASAVTLDRVSFVDNSADVVSAVSASGPIFISNSLFVGNLSSDNTIGNLIYTDTGSIEILFSTFASNSQATQIEIDAAVSISMLGNIFADSDGFSAGSISDLGGNLFVADMGSNLDEFSTDEVSELSFGFSELSETEAGLAIFPISESSLARDFVDPEVLVQAQLETGLSDLADAEIAKAVAETLVDIRSTIRTDGLIDAGSFEFFPTVVAPPSFSAPAPFAGPIAMELIELSPNKYRVLGTGLDVVTSVVIPGIQTKLVTATEELLEFDVVDAIAGEYELGLEFSGGSVATALVLVIADISLQSTEPAFWTKRISDTEIKLYAKNIIGIGKVQLFHNGNEIAWVRAESDADPKLRTANGSSYLVRTRELVSGFNVFEIYLDGERVERRVQSF